ncbi:hypothetical protein ABT093_16365 [Kitasatospora sp. NPDC002551]|uniref:hypothetical protein n=1 Tax=Kitasatospora sp. NPDC002551 TaxID=3154539 RepID=UPI0033239340
MRAGDVVLGETRIASIPQRLPARIRNEPVRTAARWQAGTQPHLARGRRITVTVSGSREEPDTVAASRDVPVGRAALRLTAEQAAALGLAEGQEYEITGTGPTPTARPSPSPARSPAPSRPAGRARPASGWGSTRTPSTSTARRCAGTRTA